MEPNIFRMLFLSKIKNLWCCKTPVPWVGPKNPFPTWDIDPAGYLLKRSFHPLKMGTIKSSFWVRMVLSYFWVQNKWGCPQRHEKNSFGDISRRDFYLDANATLCSFWPHLSGLMRFLSLSSISGHFEPGAPEAPFFRQPQEAVNGRGNG